MNAESGEIRYEVSVAYFKIDIQIIDPSQVSNQGLGE